MLQFGVSAWMRRTKKKAGSALRKRKETGLLIVMSVSAGRGSESNWLESEDAHTARFAVVAAELISCTPPEQLDAIAGSVTRWAEAMAERPNTILRNSATAFERLHAKIEVRLPPERLNAIALQVGREVEVLVERLSPALAKVERTVELLQAAPEVAGYERHFRSEFGYPALTARLWSCGLLRFGELLQAEILLGRRIGALVREIASQQEECALAISRCALKLRALCESGDGSPAIADAIAEAGVKPIHFDDVLERASARDRAACSELGRLCVLLSPFVPDPRGRPISRASSTHKMLLYHMRRCDRNSGYTFNPCIEDYGDPATLATRAAFGQERFCPRQAKLRRPTSSPPSAFGQGRRPRLSAPTDV